MHGLEEGRQERKREKKKWAIPEVTEKGPKEKGPKNQTSTPKSVEKGYQDRPKSWQNQPKKVQTQSQEMQKIIATSSRRSWILPGGDFPAIREPPGAILGPKSLQTVFKSPWSPP